jgi:hypothetical protein
MQDLKIALLEVGPGFDLQIMNSEHRCGGLMNPRDVVPDQRGHLVISMAT